MGWIPEWVTYDFVRELFRKSVLQNSSTVTLADEQSLVKGNAVTICVVDGQMIRWKTNYAWRGVCERVNETEWAFAIRDESAGGLLGLVVEEWGIDEEVERAKENNGP